MLTKYEQESIINWNKEEKEASIFTYDERWQKHLETQLGLKAIMNNGKGGKEYLIDKKRIKMPRATRSLTAKRKKQLSAQLANARNRNKSL